jgi:pimeloyl-ACP methyl ester carboxylesterase
VSGTGDLAYDRYRLENGEEWVMRIGPQSAPPILFLPPLFEELNRTRAFIAAMMRALAAKGFACWLPDLPGTGESARGLDACRWEDWRHAASDAARHVAAAAGRCPLIASLRGGCLIDDAVDGRCWWRFAPVEGGSLARDLVRSSLVSAQEQQGDVADFAGYPVGAHLRPSLPS